MGSNKREKLECAKKIIFGCSNNIFADCSSANISKKWDKIKIIYIYFRVRFGLMNAIDTY